MILEITSECIRLGTCNDPSDCMVALAAQNAGLISPEAVYGPDEGYGSLTARIAGQHVRYRLSKRCVKAMVKFDSGGTPVPFKTRLVRVNND